MLHKILKYLSEISQDKNLKNYFEHTLSKNSRSKNDIKTQYSWDAFWFVFIFKLLIDRDYTELKVIESNPQLLPAKDSHFEALYNVEISFPMDEWNMHEGKILNRGTLLMSYEECMQLTHKGYEFKLINCAYFKVSSNIWSILQIMNNVHEIILTKNEEEKEEKIKFIVKKFIESTPLPGRIYVCDLIIRDISSILVDECIKITQNGGKLIEIKKLAINFIEKTNLS